MIVSHVTPVNNVTGAWARTATDIPIDPKTGALVVIPADQTQPSIWISPGIFETGRPYYWRVRGSRAISTGENATIIHSPWSPVMLFSVQPGFAVAQDYNGPTLLNPVNGPCQGCLPPLSFSWSPVKNAKKYEFILASDPELKAIITKATTTTTAFEYKDKLELSKAYYWQVKAISPIVSDASPVGTFTVTSAAEVLKAEQKQIEKKQAEQKQQTAAKQGPADFWIWIIIVISMVLLILINIYAFVSRRND